MKFAATVESLQSHPLVKQGLLEAVKVQKNLNDRHPVRVDPDYERDPDEYEFYLICVGHALAELLNLCEQICQIGAYLSRFTQNAATKRVGITRDPDGHFKFLHLWPGQNPPLDARAIA